MIDSNRIRKVGKIQRARKLACRSLAAVLTGLLILNEMPINALAEGTAKQQETAKDQEVVDLQEAGTQVTVKKKDLRIKTAQDLAEFAKACRDSDYSAGREVYLEADIDLKSLPTGMDFDGISSFSGTFHGNRHTISGVVLSGGNKSLGLFRYIEVGAAVKDLVVSGSIDCDNSKNMVGGIAGINAGTIKNCEFRGSINSVGVIGGLVGFNGTEGAIVKCSSQGTINGSHMVGGIVGKNYGVVSDCINQASVNAGTDWLSLEDNSEQEISVSGVFGTLQEEVEEGTDFGGIAGWSSGILAGCENCGTVGYLHSGRNVGGIVGRQNGEVIRCINSGRVYGKQDVGGIVGQMEPQTVYEDVEELDEKVQELHDLMEQMVNDMEAMGDALHQDFKDLNQESSEAGDTADALMDEMRDVIQKNVDVINDLSGRIDYAMNHFAVVTTYLNMALDQVDDILDDLDQVREDLSIGDQMEEDPYDAAKEKRLVLMAGIGGSLSADNVNPAEEARVVITIRPERGYRLTELTQKSYGGEKRDVLAEVENDKYVIESMPKENQTVSAVFEYVGGEYIVQSNAGGKAFLSGDQKTLKLEPGDGYRVESVRIDGGDSLYSGQEETLELPKAAEGKNQMISVHFEKREAAHKVTVVTGTGGNVTADPQVAAAGETVQLSFTTGSGYELDSTSVSVKDAAGQEIPYETGLSYRFVMPDSDVQVESAFLYHPTENTTVYAVSNAGGSVSTFTNPTTGNTNVAINCENGYVVDSMRVLDSAQPEPNVYVIPGEDMTQNGNVYTYELATSTLTNPVRLEVSFIPKTEVYYSVTVISGVGGTAAADKLSVTGGDLLKIAVASETHYYLRELLIGGTDHHLEVENNSLEYEVPEGITGDLEIAAVYSPAVLISESSTAGGKAVYTVKGQEVIFTITPDTGYRLKQFTLVDAEGKEIPCQKEYADSEIYKFRVELLQNKAAYLQVEFELLNNKETVEEAKDTMENQTDHVVDGVNQISQVAEKIEELLTDEYGNARNPEDLSQEEIEELSSLLLEMFGYVSDTGVAAGGVLGSTNTIIKVVGPYAEDAAENTDQDLEKLSGDARAMNDSLQNAGKELQGILNYLNALENLKAVGFSDKFEKNSDQLKNHLDTISGLLDRLNDHAEFHSEKLQQDMRDVNDKMNEVFTLLIRKLDNVENLVNGEDIYEDRSEEAKDGDQVSQLQNCKNQGVINGDRNVGGIAGCMGVETLDTGSQKKYRMGNKYAAKSVVSGCTNEGFLTVKTENGGGIAGKLEIGLVEDCIGGGRVQSEGGNYIGGIVGISTGSIAACSSMAVLKGGCYVGGIAGQAGRIRDSYSMASVLSAEGFVGAIAGQDAADDEDAEDITLNRRTIRDRMKGNYYVSSGLFGVNGVSYVGAAEPISYRELLMREEVPSEFMHLQVVFLDEEENIVEQRELPYGTDLTELAYPQIMTESGDYMEWEGLCSPVLEGTAVIQARSKATVTILSSEKQENGKAKVLAAGTFTQAAKVLAEDYQGEGPSQIPEGTVCHMYHVTLENAGVGKDTVTRVRLWNEEGKRAEVYYLDQGQWKKVQARTIGSYEEVEMRGTEAVFCVASAEKNSRLLWVGIGAAIGSVLLLGIFFTAKNAKRKKRKTSYRG